MKKQCLYIAPTPALNVARTYLLGFPLAQVLSDQVTHVLLPIPTREIPADLPENVTVIGGNLPKDLAQPIIDLLQDPVYLAQNAAITASGAIKVAMAALPVCLWECNTLILGWGRIAQCLAHLLKGMGVTVTVAARRAESVALAEALGFPAIALDPLDYSPYRLVFNTIPASLNCQEADFAPRCTKIDLASTLALPGNDVIWARGLPGKEAPESSGKLIARRVAYYLNKE